jgi:LemA protein
MVIGLIVLAVLVGLVGFGIAGFNKLRTLDVASLEALGGIDVQLTRRADLIPNLVNTVKGYAQHEKGVFEEVTKARAGVQAAAQGGSVEEKAAAQARLDHAIIDVLAVAEAYPDLKATVNFQQLQTALTDTEDQLAFARQFYNDAVSQQNTAVRTIPWLLFTGIAGVHAREFYNAPEGQETAPSVSFDQTAPPPAAPPAEAPPAPDGQ